MYSLRQSITNLKDGVLNENIYIKDKKVYVKTQDHEYLYDNFWHIKVGTKWVDLQGGIPSVDVEFVDNELFNILFESNETKEND